MKALMTVRVDRIRFIVVLGLDTFFAPVCNKFKGEFYTIRRR